MKLTDPISEIKGVGEKTEQRLLLHFGSVPRIAAASVQEIAALVGEPLAKLIHQSLNNSDEE